MAKFRSKPVVVEAVRVSDALFGATSSWKSLPSWLAEHYESGYVLFAYDHVVLSTPEGSKRGDRGDWIVRHANGDIYPCTADVFERTYDAVEQ
jgi:hypothetical protein